MTVFWLIIYMAAACVLQLVLGCIDVRLFAFPVGIAIGGGMVSVLYVLESEYSRRKWLSEMRSPRMAWRLTALLAVACVIAGCLPPEKSFQTSIPFVAVLIALMVHLTLVIIHRLRTTALRNDMVFLSTHTGIWLALFCGLAGAGDYKELRCKVGYTYTTTSAIDAKGHVSSLPFSLRLKDFDVERSKTGSPIQYSATILINDVPQIISVNSPYAASLYDDVYLMGFDDECEAPYCILMVCREPWKYPMLAGILMLLCGTMVYGVRKFKQKEHVGTVN